MIVNCSEDSFDLAEGALIASGVRSRERRESYLVEISIVAEQVKKEMPKDDAVALARYLFRWLWRGKPSRYQPGGEFRLHRVIKNQLDSKRGGVGNCLGLTLLYNVLAQRLGLEVKAIYLERAFEDRPHVLTLLIAEDKAVDIENILPNGFGYRGHWSKLGRQVWGDGELVADVYLSRGNDFFQQGKFKQAVGCYRQAIRLNPRYTKAYLNCGMALTQLGRLEEARMDLGRAP